MSPGILRMLTGLLPPHMRFSCGVGRCVSSANPPPVTPALSRGPSLSARTLGCERGTWALLMAGVTKGRPTASQTRTHNHLALAATLA